MTAIRQTLEVAEWDTAAAVLDSALFTGAIDRATADDLCDGAPPRIRLIKRLLDGRAESGIETLVRVRLARAGVLVRPQVVIPGIGRVDLLVGDRLVIEVDGREFHGPDRFEADRRRDLELAAYGLRSVRLSYRQVVNDWSATEDVLRRLLDDGEHRASNRSLFRIDSPPRRGSTPAGAVPQHPS